MEKALIYFSCLFCFTLAAKPSFDTLSVSDNSKIISLNSEKKSIYIFCPINSSDYTKEIYLEKFDKFFKKSKIQAIDSVHFKLIFYKRSTNKSKGLNIYFSKLDSLVLVNDFEVYFQNFERDEVYNTSQRSDIKKRYVTNFKNDFKLSKVDISENVNCFNNLAERIPEYENFISQLINPVYTDAEKIVKLEVALKEQQIKIDSLNIDLNNFNKQLDSLLKRIELIENPKPIDMPKPTENPKNKRKLIEQISGNKDEINN
jgi:hypothetical protein